MYGDDRRSPGSARSRILHPIWQEIDGRPVGWIVTNKSPLKTRHLAANPHVACMYWCPDQHTVSADCATRWVDDAATKRQVWDLFMTTPPPVGYDLRDFGMPGPDAANFTPLRLDPWRVPVMRFEGWGKRPRLWRADDAK